jgi:prevent-host-death family protein
MSITTITSRHFNQDVGYAKRAAGKGPVFITDRGRPSHVLLSVEQYRKILGQNLDILELLAMPEAANVEFDPPKLQDDTIKPEIFS